MSEIKTRVAKAATVLDEVNASNKQVAERANAGDLFKTAGALAPPYDPALLHRTFEHSSALRPNIDSYKTNIDGYGYRFTPAIDVKADDVIDVVSTSMYFDKITEAQLAAGPDNTITEVPAITEAEAEEKIENIAYEMRLEKLKVDHWFSNCCDEMSFVELRQVTRQDLEITGNAYWEVMRDSASTPAKINHMPAFTMRLMPADSDVTSYDKVTRTISGLGTESKKSRKRFRRYVQIFGTTKVYFKQYGDQRTLSPKTGKYYKDVKVLDAKEPGIQPATEILHFDIYSSESPYGVPRWVGSLINVMGNRSAEEVNYSYFENKAIPPMALLVSGGKLGDESFNRIQDFIRDDIKGKKNFHDILILEAEPPTSNLDPSAPLSIKFEKLKDAQQQDALFLEYQKANTETIGNAFRLPKLLRGDVADFNRATAHAALQLAEGQIFEPERNQFDHIINQTIMRDIDVKWWDFKSNSANKTNPVEIVEMVSKLVDILPPSILQQLAEPAFNENFPVSDEDWTKKPGKVHIAETRANQNRNPETGADKEEVDASKNFVNLLMQARSVIAEREAKEASAFMSERIEGYIDTDEEY